MKRALAVSLAACTLMMAGGARADWSMGAGFEALQWKESTSPTVEETGLRWVLDLTWSQSKAPGVSVGYNVKLYAGNVDYEGAGLFTGTPLSGETHYRGITNEVQAWYRMPNAVDFMLAMGWDQWRRKFSATGQQEDWTVLYAKLGVSMNAQVRQGFIGSAGVKYPVYTRENANFSALGASSNPRLRPGKDVSFYATAGWRVTPAWDVYAYYDGYRFKESDPVSVAGLGTFIQPESKQDLWGMKVQYNFQ
jgi:hypothetical protein